MCCARRVQVLAGGEEALMDEYADLMRSYAATVLHMGPAGAASHVKIITNQLAAAHLVAAGEAVSDCNLAQSRTTREDGGG